MEGGGGVEVEGGWKVGTGVKVEARVVESWLTPEVEERGRRIRIRAVEGVDAGNEGSGLGDLLAVKIESPLRFPSVLREPNSLVAQTPNLKKTKS
jgi:hypothetical protein